MTQRTDHSTGPGAGTGTGTGTGTAAGAYTGTDTDTAISEALFAAARAWLAEDPDPATRTELTDLLEAAESGDAVAYGYLEDRFDGRLQFGTAGLRGELGAGPNRMNRVDGAARRRGPGRVRHRAARRAGRSWRSATTPGTTRGASPRTPPRSCSAPDTGRTCCRARCRRRCWRSACWQLGAKAGVMVTASHNPARDNGYKVYLGDGSQIVPPTDALIAAKIDAVGALADVPRGAVEDAEVGAGGPGRGLRGAVDGAGGRSPPTRDLRYVYTAMHGVGCDAVPQVLTGAGFAEPLSGRRAGRAGSGLPDRRRSRTPRSPARWTWRSRWPRDTDADLDHRQRPGRRPAARSAVPDQAAPAAGGACAATRSDCCSADYLARRGPPRHLRDLDRVLAGPRPRSPTRRGSATRETLTGFKWIVDACPDLAFGYEEALGYCVDPGARAGQGRHHRRADRREAGRRA